MVDPNSVDTITNLGGTGAIVGLFIWYLNKRDTLLSELTKSITAMGTEITKRLVDLTHVVGSMEKRISEIENNQKRRGRPRKKA